MTAKHTQGPWKINYTKFSEIMAENGALIAKVNKLNGLVNLEANARLIAAAPELLAALHNMLEDGDETDRKQALEAIKKAEGLS